MLAEQERGRRVEADPLEDAVAVERPWSSTETLAFAASSCQRSVDPGDHRRRELTVHTGSCQGGPASIEAMTAASPQARRRRNPQASRRAILDAAEELFSARGYDGASLGEIGRRAGTSSALPAYFFGGKDGLYRAVLERLLAEREERLGPLAATAAELLERTGELRAALEVLIDGYIDFLRERPALVRLMAREALDGGRRLGPGPRHSVALQEGLARFVRSLPAGPRPADRFRAASDHDGRAVLLPDRAQRHDARGDGPRRCGRALLPGAQAPRRGRARADPRRRLTARAAQPQDPHHPAQQTHPVAHCRECGTRRRRTNRGPRARRAIRRRRGPPALDGRGMRRGGSTTADRSVTPAVSGPAQRAVPGRAEPVSQRRASWRSRSRRRAPRRRARLARRPRNRRSRGRPPWAA